MPDRLLLLGRILRWNRRERHNEAGTALGKVERVDRAVVRFDDGLDYGQAQARSSGASAARQVGAVEAVEEEFRIVVAKPASIVLHGKDGAPLEAKQLDGDVPFGFDEARGVFHQVEHHLLESPRISQHVGRFAGEGDVCSALLQDGSERVQHIVREAVQVDADQLDRRRVVFNPLKSEQVIRQATQTLAFADDDGTKFLMHLWRQIGVKQKLGVPMDCGQRRAQLMCHIANELRLAALLEGKVALLGLGGLGKGEEAP